MTDIGSLKLTTPRRREIVLTRVFAAPRSVIFDAMTRPALLRRWFGPRGWSLVVCEVDLKVGGTWRFVLRGPDGAEMGLRGVYREIAQPERVVDTETFDGFPGESLRTTVLVEDRGRTTLTVRYDFAGVSRRVDRLREGAWHGRGLRQARGFGDCAIVAANRSRDGTEAGVGFLVDARTKVR